MVLPETAAVLEALHLAAVQLAQARGGLILAPPSRLSGAAVFTLTHVVWFLPPTARILPHRAQTSRVLRRCLRILATSTCHARGTFAALLRSWLADGRDTKRAENRRVFVDLLRGGPNGTPILLYSGIPRGYTSCLPCLRAFHRSVAGGSDQGPATIPRQTGSSASASRFWPRRRPLGASYRGSELRPAGWCVGTAALTHTGPTLNYRSRKAWASGVACGAKMSKGTFLALRRCRTEAPGRGQRHEDERRGGHEIEDAVRRSRPRT
jgi:hypothetical protein